MRRMRGRRVAKAAVLLTDRHEIAERPRLPIGLKARLDEGAERDPCLPGITEKRMAVGKLAEILLEEQVDGVDRRSDLLAQ